MALGLLAGCATPFQVTVSSFSRPEATQYRSFFIFPAEQGITLSDFQFQEARGYLVKALVSRGYREAKSLLDSEIVIFLQYAIGDPQRYSRSYSIPIIGQTGGGTSYVNATSYGTYGINTVSGTVTQTPTYGVTGYNSGTVNHTIYGRWMRIEAIDYAEFVKTQSVKSLWETKITSVGSSGDLRRVLPIMVAAAEPHFGGNTGKAVEIVLRENDERVEKLRSRPL